MTASASRFKYHVFICQTQRPPMAKPSCGPRGAGDIVLAMQEQLANHPELWGSVMITPSGCLGPCFAGPSMVVYPEAIWYCGVEGARTVTSPVQKKAYETLGRTLKRAVGPRGRCCLAQRHWMKLAISERHTFPR